MEKMHVRDVTEIFHLYDEETGRGVTCVVSSDGTYEVFNKTSSTFGKAESYAKVLDRCRDVALDYFKYDSIKIMLAQLQKLAGEISSDIEHR